MPKRVNLVFISRAGEDTDLANVIASVLRSKYKDAVEVFDAKGLMPGQEWKREIKKALRKTLLTFQLHQDAELFERAYGYIRTYY